MYAIMPPTTPPPFPFNHDRSRFQSRPVVPSPLSSSPIRATSPPLASRDPNSLPRRQTQSSPIPCPSFSSASASGSASKFLKYERRETRPNPLVTRKREDAQEGRRKLFLRNVRQRADDKAWERRGGENELLKLEWWRLNRELRQSKDADFDGVILEPEIEYEDELREETDTRRPGAADASVDDMMLDAFEQEQEAEIDALIASHPESGQMGSSQLRPDSPHFSDEDDYDALFNDLLAEESLQNSQGLVLSQDVEMS